MTDTKTAEKTQKSLIFMAVVSYSCAGCGWRWTREMKAHDPVLPRRIVVPAAVSPCCKGEA